VFGRDCSIVETDAGLIRFKGLDLTSIAHALNQGDAGKIVGLKTRVSYCFIVGTDAGLYRFAGLDLTNIAHALNQD
jgi:hypothetical protein